MFRQISGILPAVLSTWMLAAALAFPGSVQNQPTPRTLNPGDSLEDFISRPETVGFSLELKAGQYVRLRVEPRASALAAVLEDPDGRTLVAVQNPGGMMRSLLLSAISTTAGKYSLRLHVPERSPLSEGRFSVRIDELRQVRQEQDETRIAAQQELLEAENLRASGTATDIQQTITHYRRCLELWRSVDDRAWEGLTLTLLGQLLDLAGEKQEALERFQQAFDAASPAGDLPSQALALYGIGKIYTSMEESALAIDFFQRALPLKRQLEDSFGEALILHNLGAMHWALGGNVKALDYYREALKIRETLGDRLGIAFTLYGIAVVHWSLGEFQEALRSYQQMLPLWRQEKNVRGEANTLNNMGLVYEALKDPDRAIRFFEDALALWQSAGDRSGEAYSLNNLAMVHAGLGLESEAIEEYARSLEGLQSLQDRRGQSYVLHNLGRLYLGQAATQKALDHFGRSLELKRAIGDLYGEAYTLDQIGESRLALGDLVEARRFYRQALDLRQTVGDKSGEVLTLGGLARVEEAAENFEEAQGLLATALASIEKLRLRFDTPDLRTTYFATQRDYYDFYIRLLIGMERRNPDRGYDRLAFQASERARARSLLDSLPEGPALSGEADPELLAAERNLRQQVDGISARLSRMHSSPYPAEKRTAVEKELTAALDQYQDLKARIRKSHPALADLIAPVPAGVDEIQQQLLRGEQTILLEYSLGEAGSFLWALSEDEIHFYDLPSREVLERATRRLHDALIERNKTVPNESLDQKSGRLGEADRVQRETGLDLSRLLLGPVAAQIEGKRLLIVAEGALQLIPFSMLPIPSATGTAAEDGGKWVPLAAEHEIVHLPSASVLVAHRRDLAQASRGDRVMAVFADPVFEAADSRVSGSADPPASALRSVTDGAPDPSRLTRLRFSRIEAEEIGRLAPAERKLIALDFSASRQTLESQDLRRYRFLHFATHTLVDFEHPELSGIVLSLVDEKGTPQNGFLRAYDLYNLQLSGNVVVLSSCQTALGRDVRGEGLMGLTRGFLYAGAATVVASLWSVDDRATGQLMTALYRGMLEQGLSPASALQKAQLEISRDPRWKNPYYWAAFTVQGDWKEIGPE